MQKLNKKFANCKLQKEFGKYHQQNEAVSKIKTTLDTNPKKKTKNKKTTTTTLDNTKLKLGTTSNKNENIIPSVTNFNVVFLRVWP